MVLLIFASLFRLEAVMIERFLPLIQRLGLGISALRSFRDRLLSDIGADGYEILYHLIFFALAA